MSDLKFNGESGRKPQTEARRYVYAVLASMLDAELSEREGWMFGGLDHEPDRRRVKKAIDAVYKELTRKAKSQ